MGSETDGSGGVPQTAGLPHTRTRAGHWITTAAALAAVIGAGGLAGPSEVSASPPVSARSAPGAAPSGDTSPPAPDPRAAAYPLDCAGAPIAVAKEVSADLDGDGRLETAAAVHCDAGGGNPPHGLFVLSAGTGPGAPPRIVARLDNKNERVFVTALAVRGRTLVAQVSGYSGPDVPSCCPDIKTTARWQWKAGAFTLVEPPGTAAG